MAAVAGASRRADMLVRAESSVGQSATLVDESAVRSLDGSWLGQCASLASAGATHVASHHARAGAAAPTITTASRMNARFTKSV